MHLCHSAQPVSTDHQVTGRDGYIIVKALAYAIAVIEALPVARQEGSDCDDMRDLLCHLVPAPAARNHMATAIGEALQMPVQL